MRLCEISGCDRGHYARGWCEKHYDRWRRHGDPQAVMVSSPGHTLSERFLFRGWMVRPGPLDTDCWVWNGTPDARGYGIIRFDGKNLKAHRVSYEHHFGAVPPGSWVLHACDVPICVNPLHLRTGTAMDNVSDRESRGRGNRKRNPETGRWLATGTKAC